MQSLAQTLPAPRDRRDLLRTIAEGTAGTVGAAFLRSLARCLAASFVADVAYVAELADPPTRARILACWPGGELLPEGYEYDLAGTPCEPIAERDVISHPAGAAERFASDSFLVRNGLDGYLAVPMRDAGGDVVGYVCVISRGRVDAGEEDVAVLRIFAARAAAELDRRRHEAALRAREAEVAASRTRLLHAADEERRRIGRDLHDGAQQRLVAVGQWLDLAQRSGPEDAERFIANAREQATLAGRELRPIVDCNGSRRATVAVASRSSRSGRSARTSSAPRPRAAPRSTSGWRATARSTPAAATRSRSCWASPAGA